MMLGMDNKAPHMLREWLAKEGRKSLWIAAKIDVSPATVSQWLSGERPPLPANRRRLAALTGLPIAHEEAWV